MALPEKRSARPPILTAEDAAQRADLFLNRYYAFKTLLSVKKAGGLWHLVYDVSVIPPRTRVNLSVDADSGKVTAYDTEPRS